MDLFAPASIRAHPGSAAVDAAGRPSAEQVSLAELADGAFGQRALEMIEYLAADYPIDAVDVTEAAYGQTSFGAADLASFRQRTGRRDWPRDARGHVDTEDPAVWEWKSRALRALRRAGGRRRPPPWEAALRRRRRRAGRTSRARARLRQDYERILRDADRIVVWDYFALEHLPPAASGALARHLAARFPASHFDLSIGLWSEGGAVVGPEALATALDAALAAGATRIRVTPNDRVTGAHWAEVARRLAGP